MDNITTTKSKMFLRNHSAHMNPTSAHMYWLIQHTQA